MKTFDFSYDELGKLAVRQAVAVKDDGKNGAWCAWSKVTGKCTKC